MALSTVRYALFAHDDALVRIDAVQILDDTGFRCFDVETGDEAHALMKEKGEQIILLFTDMEMTGSLNGFDLARRTAQTWPEIEIVAARGGMTPAPGEMPERAAFIGKPLDTNVVHYHLAKTLPDGKEPEPLKQAV